MTSVSARSGNAVDDYERKAQWDSPEKKKEEKEGMRQKGRG